MNFFCAVRAGIYVLVLSFPQNDEATPLTLQQIVDANASALGLIGDIDLVYEKKAIATPSWPKVSASPATFRWTRSGDKERRRQNLRVEARSKADDGIGFSDIFIEGKSCKFLGGWDPDHSAPLLPHKQRNVRAMMLLTKDQFTVPAADPTVDLLFRLQLNNSEEPSTLAALTRKYPSTLKGKTRIRNRELFEIYIAVPNEQTPADPGSITVFLDPAANFMISEVRTVTTSIPAGFPGPKDPAFRMTGTLSVSEFTRHENGVYIPASTEVTNTFRSSSFKGERETRSHGVVKNVIVNSALPADVFDFKFPKYALVRHVDKTENGRRRVELWGDDNTAIKEIKDASDLAPFVSADTESVPAKSPWLVIIVCVNVAFVAVFVLYRYLIARQEKS